MKQKVNTDFNIHKNIIIFGAGKVGQECYRILKQKSYCICFFCDNDLEKQGKYIDGIPIREIAAIRERDSLDTTVVIAVRLRYEDEIEDQLINKGIFIEYMCVKFSQLCMPQLRTYYMEAKKKYTEEHLLSCLNIDILFDYQVFMMQKNGGISRYFYEIIKRIKKQCTVDCFEGFNHNDYSKNALRVKKDEQYLLEYAEILNYGLFNDFSKNKKYKIYHPTYYQDFGIENVKVHIITVHDMIHELYHMDKQIIENKKNMICKADGIIAVSENTKKDIIDLYNIDEKKIKVIYHGNSLHIKCSTNPIIKEPYILYVGKRKGYKDAITLLYAFSECRYCKDLKLVFFGGGEFTKNEEECFSELGLADYIQWVSGDDIVLANLYQYAELFVYPSLYEGFGLPILEAMHYGTPVITARSSSLTEVGGDAVTYFEPGSKENLAECIDYLLNNNSKRREMSQVGIKREKLFSWDKSANEHIKFYQQFF